jgi:hypothetical protein
MNLSIALCQNTLTFAPDVFALKYFRPIYATIAIGDLIGPITVPQRDQRKRGAPHGARGFAWVLSGNEHTVDSILAAFRKAGVAMTENTVQNLGQRFQKRPSGNPAG